MSSYDYTMVRVSELEESPHPTAEHLSVYTYGGLPFVARRDEIQKADWAWIILQGRYVDTRNPAFAWLKGKARTDGLYKVKRQTIRGEVSEGLLIPVTDEGSIFADVYPWNTRYILARYDKLNRTPRKVVQEPRAKLEVTTYYNWLGRPTRTHWRQY